jgi:MFS family permease
VIWLIGRLNTGLGLILRRLLQVDRPVPARSTTEIEVETERNYRWNFAVNLLDGTAFWFGLSLISSSTIVPLFISKLTPSPLALGLAAVIAQGSWYLPQLFTANVVERLARKKPVVVNLGFFSERVPVWFLIVATLLATRSPALALLVFLACYAWFGLGGGLVATAWQDLIARCFPVTRRGRFFGTTMFLGAGTGVLGAALSAWLLTSFPFPGNFGYIFLIAALAHTVSWFFIALVREPVAPVPVSPQSNRQFWLNLARILGQDVNFRRFLVARGLMTCGGMGWGFITVAAIQRWHIPDGTVGIYTAVYLAGQTAGNLALGFVGDRFGHKVALESGAVASFLAFGLAWLAPAPEWYFLVFFLLGFTLGALIVSGILVVFEFSQPSRRPTYTGLANTGVGVISLVAPLVGAWLAGVGYGWLFALSAAVNLAAWVALHWWVKEPRWSGTGAARDQEST